MRAADCKPYRSFYELLTGKELPWPKAASVGGLFVFEDDSYWQILLQKSVEGFREQ